MPRQSLKSASQFEIGVVTAVGGDVERPSCVAFLGNLAQSCDIPTDVAKVSDLTDRISGLPSAPLTGSNDKAG